MPRLINRDTGVVVNVDDDTARTLGDQWVPAEPSKPAPRKRQPVKK